MSKAKPKQETTEITKTEPAPLVDLSAFAPPPTEEPAMDLVLPIIKMSKTDLFEMPGGEFVKELHCYIILLRKTRAYFKDAYGQSDSSMPTCASSDGKVPDMGDEFQAETCDKCPKADYDDNEGKFPCSVSYVMLLALDGEDIPYLLRVRSTSCGRKSSLSKFFTNCFSGSYKDGKWDGFALVKGGYATVSVKLTLEKTKINNFDTSSLIVDKTGLLDVTSPRAVSVLEMHQQAKSQFVASPHVKPDDGIESTDDEIPI